MLKVNNSFAIYTAGGRILAMLCNFSLPILLTRLLTKEDYGIYSQLTTLLLFSGSIFSFGLQTNLYYFYQKANNHEKKTLVGNTLLSMIIFAIFSLMFLKISFFENFLIKDKILKQNIEIIQICIFFTIPTHILFPLFIIRHDKILSTLYPPIEIIIKVLILILSIKIYGTIKGILYSFEILNCILFIFVIIYSLIPVYKEKGPWVNIKILRKQLSYALPFGFSVILFTICRQFDKILCIKYISSSEYAIYSLSFFGIPFINQIYDSVSEVNLINIAAEYNENHIKESINIYKDFCSKLLSFSFPIILIIYIFAYEIYDFLFTKEYLSAVPYFRIYIISFIIGALGAGTVLKATGNTQYTLKAYIYTLLIYLPFSYFSIKTYKTWGAISTAMVGIIFPAALKIYYEKEIFRYSFIDYLPWKQFGKTILLSILLSIPLIIVNYYFNLNIWFDMIVSIIYILCVYCIEIKQNLFLLDKESINFIFNKYIKNKCQK